MDAALMGKNSFFFYVVLIFAISGCASLKKHFCDCPCAEGSHAAASATGVYATSHGSGGGASSARVNKPINVSEADLELTTKMQEAMDDYVLKGDVQPFTNLCADPRFDCSVNEKRFPKTKKKIRRKVPPFMSGSKMGTVGDQKVTLKYNFYP